MTKQTEVEEKPIKLSKKAKSVIERLAEQDILTPVAVVAEASKEGSPLHRHFCWDDAKAAHYHRMEQARKIIRSVQVDITTGDMTVRVPAYVRDMRVATRQQGYVSIKDTKRRPAQSRALVHYEFTRAIGILMRAAEIAEALGYAKDIRKIVKGIEDLDAHMSD